MCTNGTYARFECRGPKGCADEGSVISCDHTVANVDDACGAEGNVTCTTDLARRLECTGGKYLVVAECRGPAKCTHEGTVVGCDETVGEVGDLCGQEGGYRCSADGKLLNKCVSRKVVTDENCGEQSKKCAMVAGQAGCE